MRTIGWNKNIIDDNSLFYRGLDIVRIDKYSLIFVYLLVAHVMVACSSSDAVTEIKDVEYHGDYINEDSDTLSYSLVMSSDSLMFSFRENNAFRFQYVFELDSLYREEINAIIKGAPSNSGEHCIEAPFEWKFSVQVGENYISSEEADYSKLIALEKYLFMISPFLPDFKNIANEDSFTHISDYILNNTRMVDTESLRPDNIRLEISTSIPPAFKPVCVIEIYDNTIVTNNNGLISIHKLSEDVSENIKNAVSKINPNSWLYYLDYYFQYKAIKLYFDEKCVCYLSNYLTLNDASYFNLIDTILLNSAYPYSYIDELYILN